MLCLFLNFGGSSVASRGDVSPLEILMSFPRREDEQTSRNNPKSIYSDGGEESRDSLDREEGQGIIMISQGGAF